MNLELEAIVWEKVLCEKCMGENFPAFLLCWDREIRSPKGAKGTVCFDCFWDSRFGHEKAKLKADLSKAFREIDFLTTWLLLKGKNDEK